MSDNNNKAVDREAELEQMEQELAVSSQEQDQEVEEDFTSEQESPPENEKSVEDKESDSEANADNEDLTDDEVAQLSQKAQKRYRDMAKKIKELESKIKPSPKVTDGNDDHVVRLGSIDVPQVEIPTSKDVPRIPAYNDPKEVVEAYEREKMVADVAAKTATKATRDMLLQEKTRDREQKIYTMLLDDITQAKIDYPQLDDESDSYDASLSNKVADWYRPLFDKHKSGGNYYSFKSYVDDLMSLKNVGVEEGKKEVRLKVARQAATQTLPTSSGQPTKEVTVTDLIKDAKSLADLEKLEARL